MSKHGKQNILTVIKVVNKVEIISDKKQNPSLTRAPFGPIFPRGPGKPYKNTNNAIFHACKLDQ